MTISSSLPPASADFGQQLARNVSKQLLAFGETLLAIARLEGRSANPRPYGTSWGDKMHLATWTMEPEVFDSNELYFSSNTDSGNFVVDTTSAHDKLRAEHNNGLAEPLRVRAKQEARDVVLTMRRALVLLSGRTKMAIVVACKNTMDAPMVTLTIDGHCPQRQEPPVFLTGLHKRLAPVFAGLHAVETSTKPEVRSDQIWGWENSGLRVAAPTAVDAWFKSLVLHDPTAAFDPAKRSYGFQSPVLYVDPDRVADGIADLRRALCPQGTPYP